MQLTLVALMVVSLLLVCGCSPTSLSNGASRPGAAHSALPLSNPPYPGPYKTILVDGVEMRQGRFREGKYGGQLVRSLVGGDPKGFNPWTASDSTSGQLGGLMFSGLVSVDAYNGEVFPDLAAWYKVDPDGITYITRLRKGLTWSDGRPITADDVAFTWNTIIAGGFGNSSLRDVTSIDGKSPTVEVLDALTNRFKTPKPFAPFVRLLAMPIAPKHVIEPIIKSKGGRQAFQRLWSVNCNPGSLVTDGPFVLSRFVPGQRVEFVASKNFYMVDKHLRRLPYLSRLVFQVVPDVNTNLIKFKAKEIDMTPVRCRDVVDLLAQRDSGDFSLYNLGQGQGTTFLMFNMNRRSDPKTHKPYVNPVKSSWFNDLNFRQAVNHALSRDNMVANYFKGIGFPLFTAEPPSSPYYDRELPGFKIDRELSMKLLAKSGFRRAKSGALFDRSGHRVEFDLTTSSGGTFYEFLGNTIVNDLKELGIKVNFQMIADNILLDKIENSLDWQACIMSLAAGDPLEPNDGSNVYKSNGRLHLFDQRLADGSGEVTVTDARPWEKELDQCFNQGAQTLDKEKRKAIYDRYQKIIYAEAPFIYLVSPMSIVAARNTIGNFQPTQLSQTGSGLHNIEEIYKR